MPLQFAALASTLTRLASNPAARDIGLSVATEGLMNRERESERTREEKSDQKSSAMLDALEALNSTMEVGLSAAASGESYRQRGMTSQVANTYASLFKGLTSGNIKETLKAPFEFATRVKDVSMTLIESQRELSRFNGQIAQSFITLEGGEIRRNIRSGQATSDSTRELTDAYNNLSDQLRPLNDWTTNAMNRTMTVTLEAISAMVSLEKTILLTAEKLGLNIDFFKVKTEGEGAKLPIINYMESLKGRAENNPIGHAGQRRPE